MPSKLKDRLCLVLVALALVGMAAGFLYGLQKKHDCDASGGVLIRASFSSECVKLERR